MAAASTLEVGKISAPIKTQFGWHIIKTIAKEEYPVKKFEAVKAEIEKITYSTGKRESMDCSYEKMA